MSNYDKYYVNKNKYVATKSIMSHLTNPNIYSSSTSFCGGGKIILTNENTKIIMVTNMDKLIRYRDKLIELTRICEPTDVFEPFVNEPFDIFWILQYIDTSEIVGYLKSIDLEQYKSDTNFELLGGIRNKKGLQISGACNGIPMKYSNLATLLLEKIEEYAIINNYDYVLLHAGTDREYLIGDGERKGLYIKNGYKKIRVLKKGEGNFADIDLWIMRKKLRL